MAGVVRSDVACAFLYRHSKKTLPSLQMDRSRDIVKMPMNGGTLVSQESSGNTLWHLLAYDHIN